MSTGRYSFRGQHEDYAQYRPRWPASFAAAALARAGTNETMGDRTPLVASIGAGTGSDAATFLSLGCEVLLVEPNEDLLNVARKRLGSVGRAIFRHAHADDFVLPNRPVDLMVVAQAMHTLKDRFSGDGSEEHCRRHWLRALKPDGRQRLSIWYYNPAPAAESTHILHNLLLAHCRTYRESGTPFLNAEFFRPYNFRPWIEPSEAYISGLIEVDVVRLARGEVQHWLESYSFRPDDQAELARLSKLLCEGWFDRFACNGVLEIQYQGIIVQGALRAASPALPPTAKELAITTELEWPGPAGA
jgi:SAM-dependent methyltransferase